MFVTELCHNLIMTSGCKKGDQVTLVFKSGKSKEGHNYSIWMLGKGEPKYNERGEITNLKSEKDWVKMTDEPTGKIGQSSLPQGAIKTECDVVPTDIIKERVKILKVANEDLESQIKELKIKFWEMESLLVKLEKCLQEDEEEVVEPEKEPEKEPVLPF